MNKLILAAGAAALALAGCGLGAPQYPEFSQASYRIEGTTTPADGGPATQTVIYRDGPRLRVEADLPNYGPAVVVFDQATNAAYVLSPTSASAGAGEANPNTAPPAAQLQPDGDETQSAPNADGEQIPDTETQTMSGPSATTGAPRLVPGIAVRLDDASAPQPMETAWAALGADGARSVGECNVAGEDGHEWRPREETTGVERTACITSDGIVLRIRENEQVLWQATSLQRGQQDAALFGVPPGYQLIDPQAVSEGVGETMEELDSVTGDDNPPS